MTTLRKIKNPDTPYILITLIGVLLNLAAPYSFYRLMPYNEMNEDISIVMLLLYTTVAVPLFVLLLQKKGSLLWLAVCAIGAFWPLVFVALPYAHLVLATDLVIQFFINLRISTVFSAIVGGILWLLWFRRNEPLD